MTELLVQKLQKPINTTLVAPPSKYHTHRALILGALTEGTTTITGVSQSLDNISTVRCLSLLGTEFDLIEDVYHVHGGPFVIPSDILDCGNSGSTLQFLLGIASMAPGTCLFTGDDSLRTRPLGPYLDALNRWGIEVWSTRDNGCLPVVLKHQDPRSLSEHVTVDGTISPWTTGLILLAPFTGRDITVEVDGGKLNEGSYTLLMIEMMQRFSISVEVGEGRSEFFIPAGQEFTPASIVIPGDIALASFGLVLAALSDSRVHYTNLDLGIFHPEDKIVEVLEAMGADIRMDEGSKIVEVIGGRKLKGVEIDCNDSPDMVPILSVLLSLAEGESRIVNAEQLRYKETDRLKAMTQLNKLGARVTETEDGLHFQGVDKLHGAALDSMSDHRVLMSFFVAGCLAEGETTITDAGAAAVSYPGFLDDMQKAGVLFRLKDPISK